MASTMRLPVRVAVGTGAPREIGIWELEADESGRFRVDTAEFAGVLRAAADELAPDPVLTGAYRERAHLVAYLASQHPAVIAYSDPNTPDWPVVTITTPAGQLSWHISPDDLDLFGHVPHVVADDPRAQWDGHDTPTKYERLAALVPERQ